MLKKCPVSVVLGLGLVLGLMGSMSVYAGDLDDGISKFTDENITADDNLGSKDTNISFIVTDAIAKSKMWEHTAKKEDKANDAKTGEDGEEDKDTKKSRDKKKNRINYNDGKGENNENSIVVEPGSNIDKVINIVIEK